MAGTLRVWPAGSAAGVSARPTPPKSRRRPSLKDGGAPFGSPRRLQHRNRAVLRSQTPARGNRFARTSSAPCPPRPLPVGGVHARIAATRPERRRHRRAPKTPRKDRDRRPALLQPRPELVARRPQRGRRRPPQQIRAAHFGEETGLSPALPFAPQAGIILSILRNGLAVEVCEPRLDAPRRNENGDAIFAAARRDAGLLACVIEFTNPPRDSARVAVHHDDDRPVDAAAAVLAQFLDELSAYEGVRRAPARWRPLDAKTTFRPSNDRKKSTQKRFVLGILAKDDELRFPTHRSHPLAMSSDKASPPSIFIPAMPWTRVAPEFSRRNIRPWAPPR